MKEPRLWNKKIERATGAAFDWRCPFCGVPIEEKGCHGAHISPYGTGIGFVPGNIVLSCGRCNSSMHDNHVWDWCEKKGIDYQWMLPILADLRAKWYDPAKVKLSEKSTRSQKKGREGILVEYDPDQIARITDAYADEISAMGAIPRVYKRDGSVGPNINGAIALALARLDEQARAKEQPE